MHNVPLDKAIAKHVVDIIHVRNKASEELTNKVIEIYWTGSSGVFSKMYKREPLEGHNALDNSQEKAEIVENPTNKPNACLLDTYIRF